MEVDKYILSAALLLGGGVFGGCGVSGQNGLPVSEEPPPAAVVEKAPETPSSWIWDFDEGLEGWSVESSDDSIVWSADGSPEELGAGEPYISAPNSLNYNNGVDFDSGDGPNHGVATSPVVNLLPLENPRLVFSCNFDTEDTNDYDRRKVEVYRVATDEIVTLGVLKSIGNGGDCSSQGDWHFHEFSLDRGWGEVQIRFLFDSVDEDKNQGKGWFLDDVEISSDAP